MTTVEGMGPRSTPARLLEIGSFGGWSALALAEAVERCLPAGGTLLCVDAWEPYASGRDLADPIHRAVDEAMRRDLIYGLFRHNTGLGNETGIRIDHFRGRSDEVLPYLAPGFDLINIDAGHYYADVAADIAQARRLVADGGFICGDDLELGREMVDPERCDEATDSDTLRDPRTGLVYHPGVARAVWEAFGPVRSYNGFWIVRREGNTFREVVFDRVSPLIPRHMAGMAAPHPSSAIMDMADLPTDCPVLIYGSGTAGRMARAGLRRRWGRDVSGYIDRADADSVDGLPVRHADGVLARMKKACVVVATQHWREVLTRLTPYPAVQVFVHYQVADAHLFEI